MNSKAKIFLKNFLYTLISNLVSLAISTLVVLVVPKLIGIEEYGYFQLYIFYISYVGFFHFGWNDGIYLRYGGKEYKDLDKRLFFSQYYMQFISQIIIAIIISVLSILFVVDTDKVFIFNMVAICMVVMNVRYMLLFILQATNRIKEYANITLIDRLLYCFLIILLLVFGIRNYKLLIIGDIIGRFISFIYAMWCCSDIVFRKPSSFYFSIGETRENIYVGIKLMIATISSILIIGIVRFGIERVWDVSTFGKVSLTLSISNLMMIFVNSVGVILFPALKRTEEKKLTNIYIVINNILTVLLLGILVFYYPLKIILFKWLPHYQDSLMYMALVFPMLVYESKMGLLINTYLKAMRKEKLILLINVISVILSIITTIIFTVILKNLILTVSSIFILLAFRCILSEVFLSKILGISVYKDIILELTMSLLFILTSWFISSWWGAIIYLFIYGVYLIIKKKDIINSYQKLNTLMKQ